MSTTAKWVVMALGHTLVAGAAIAQSSSPPAGAHTASDDDIPVIVVTGQRRAQNLIDVPISISALSGEQVENAGMTNVASLQRVVPGFTLTFAGAHSQPTIRGVGTQVAGIGLPSNVAIYVDGFYRPNPVTNNVDLIDVDSVQVLKGPQGTLYGRNATGGAVLITTREPQFEPTLKMNVSYGNYDTLRAGAFASGPLSEKLAGSITVFNSTGKSYAKNVVPDVSDRDRRTTIAKGKLLFKASDTASLTLGYEHTDIEDPSVFMFSPYEGISAGLFAPGGAIVESRPFHYANDYRPVFNSKSNSVFLKGVFSFAGATLTSTTSYEDQHNYSGYDVDDSSANIQHVDFPGQQETTNQELVLSSNSDGPLSWLVGGMFLHDNGTQQLIVPGAGEIIDAGVVTDSYAFYADVTYELAHGLFLTGGARYGKDKLKERFSSAFAPGVTRASVSFDDVTPRATIRYEIDPRKNVYASYNKGYKSGGFNPTSLTTASVNPEKIDAYEVGYKQSSRVWDLSLASFYYSYKNLQVSAYQGPITSLVNAAKARIYGAETTLALRPIDNLTLSLSGAYLHAEYKSFPGAPHYVFNPGDNVTPGGITVSPGDASHNPIVNSPKWSGNLNAAYTYPMGDRGSLEFHTNFTYQTVVYFDAFQATKQPAYGVLGARIGWNAPGDRFKLSAFGENLTDKEYAQAIFQQPVAFSIRYAQPRLYGIELQYSF